jgi:hypothetical protein
MPLNYHTSEAVCAYTQNVINDTTAMRIINKIFPNIFVITLLGDETTAQRTHIQYTLKKLGANYTLCVMRKSTLENYEEYLKYYNSLPETDKVIKMGEYTCAYQKMSRDDIDTCAKHAWVLSHINNPIIYGTRPHITTHTTSRLNLILEDNILPIHNIESILTQFIENNNNITAFGRLIMFHSVDYSYKSRTINGDCYIPKLNEGTIYGTGSYAVNTDMAIRLSNKLKSYNKCADQYFIEEFNVITSSNHGCVLSVPIFITDKNVDDTEFCKRTSINNYDYIPLIGYSNVSYVNALCEATISPIWDALSIFKLDKLHTLSQMPYYNEFCNGLERTSWTVDDFKTFLTQTSPEVVDAPADLAVCIAYFNPLKRIRPFQNLMLCCQRITAIGVPVFIIELGYNNEHPTILMMPNTYYITSNSYLFHKENLWNILEKKIPEQYTKLVFLDGDILFKDTLWATKISSQLESTSVLQVFESVEYLDMSYMPYIINVSFIKSIQERQGSIFGIGNFSYPCNGMGFACQRKWFRKVGGFPERFVMGCGDIAWLSLVIGSNEFKTQHGYLGEPYAHASYDILGKMMSSTKYTYSCAPLTIQHLYHGNTKGRQYVSRHEFTKALKDDDLIVNSDGLIQFKEPDVWNPITYKYFTLKNDDDL